MIFFRTIDELVSLYELENFEHDIYVEGFTDKILVEQYLSKSNIDDVFVYEINSVNIPYSEFVETGMPDGNRSRVIFLAQQLEDKCSIDLFNHVICIADLDFDGFYEQSRSGRLLLYTEGTSLELYAFDSKVLKKFFSIALRRPELDPDYVLSAIEPVLKELFTIRLVSMATEINGELLPIEKHCVIKQGNIKFSCDSYIDKFLQKSSKWSVRELFYSHKAAVKIDPEKNVRMFIHGHDFLSVLRYYLEKVVKPKSGFNEDLFNGAIMSSIEKYDLDNYLLFQEIVNRFT